MDTKLLQPILDAFVTCKIEDKFLQKAILANMKKECGLIPKEENLNYSKTSNDRIRKIFGTRASRLTDEQLTNVKKFPQDFAELVYGKGNLIGSQMGNTEIGDGWKYRGRGYIQLTGKNNYKFFGDLVGIDLINNPDILVNDRFTSAVIAISFVKYGLKDNLTFTDQASANKAVTQVIGGRGLNLTQGYGKELLSIVNKYADEFELA